MECKDLIFDNSIKVDLSLQLPVHTHDWFTNHTVCSLCMVLCLNRDSNPLDLLLQGHNANHYTI